MVSRTSLKTWKNRAVLKNWVFQTNPPNLTSPTKRLEQKARWWFQRFCVLGCSSLKLWWNMSWNFMIQLDQHVVFNVWVFETTKLVKENLLGGSLLRDETCLERNGININKDHWMGPIFGGGFKQAGNVWKCMVHIEGFPWKKNMVLMKFGVGVKFPGPQFSMWRSLLLIHLYDFNVLKDELFEIY